MTEIKTKILKGLKKIKTYFIGTNELFKPFKTQ